MVNVVVIKPIVSWFHFSRAHADNIVGEALRTITFTVSGLFILSNHLTKCMRRNTDILCHSTSERRRKRVLPPSQKLSVFTRKTPLSGDITKIPYRFLLASPGRYIFYEYFFSLAFILFMCKRLNCRFNLRNPHVL